MSTSNVIKNRKNGNLKPTDELTNIVRLSELDFLKEKSAATKVLSAMVEAKQTTIKETEKNTRSVSAYFKEFRKNFASTETYLREAHKKGRTFNSDFIHDILMNGNLKKVTDADLILVEKRSTEAQNKGKKYTRPTQWSAKRVWDAFIFAVETTQPKSK